MDIKNFYVSPNGCDRNCGCKDKPFATIEKALGKIKDAVASGKYSQVNIILCEGEYNVESLKLTSEHSGTVDCPVTIKSLDGAVISGGRETNSCLTCIRQHVCMISARSEFPTTFLIR